ncbi:Efflux transporter, RND family, MFP subunit [Candidatus Sulfopaludibacter sp. SbA6]|nr:Efflux transporter, RND family, MFP subunit [Candidatus Sulfopaludibacter sp. SbA6]
MSAQNHFVRIMICAACLFALAGCKQQPQVRSMGPPVVPVSVAKAVQESVPTELRVVGTVDASSIVQVKSQVAGELVKVAFTEGQNIAKGDLLFQIDPRPFEDALRQAEANVARDRAQIAQAEAALARDSAQAKFNEGDAVRYAELQKEGLASKSQSDQSKTSADVAREAARVTQATIESSRAALAADEAAVAAAKLNLDYCQIHAPISGRTGNLLVHAGNLVKVNDVSMVIIHQVEPIFVDFSVPEQHLATIRRLNSQRKLAVRVFTRDNPDRAAVGSLSVIDNTVDSSTGTIHLKGTFANRDGTLWPGQFVTAVLTLDTNQNATVIPAEAVQNGQQGQFVYLVKADHTVEMRIVTPGRLFGKKTVIDKGIAPGDTVVIDGQLRLFPGAQVQLVDPDRADPGTAKPNAGQS